MGSIDAVAKEYSCSLFLVIRVSSGDSKRVSEEPKAATGAGSQEAPPTMERRKNPVPHLLLPTSGRATDVRDLDTSPGTVQRQSKPLATPSLYKADG